LLGSQARRLWPLVAPAQPAPVIGFINSASQAPFAHLAAGFRKGLGQEGFVVGRNVMIEERWAEGRYHAIPMLIRDLLERNVAVLAATGGAVAGVAAKAATGTVRIVFVMGGDPEKFGLVQNLNRPGANVTGITQLTTELSSKRLGLLLELVPNTRKLGVLLNPDFPDASPQAAELQSASSNAGLEAVVVRARTEADFHAAFARLEQERVDALIVGADPFFYSRRHLIVSRIAGRQVPTIFEFREFAEAGGLMSYGTDLADAYRLVGVYVGRILKGERPAELPVMQAAKFELVLNLKTAKALGLTIPPTLLARADEVIE
jgi:putative tryptophan/tyrosine transport system substrate-binding protein